MKGTDYYTQVEKEDLMSEIISLVLDYLYKPNVLPFALDSDGVTTYNHRGYKTNTIWDTGSNTEIAYAGMYLSGYIPISSGDIVYLKNVGFNSTSSTNAVHFFTDDFSQEIGTYGVSALTTYSNATYGADGNLSSFAIGSTDATHIRIQGSGFSPTSIITINEPIDF